MNNSITVVGRVGQVPSSISFADTGKQLVKFSVAVKEFSPNTDEEKTLWFDVNAWNGLGERALKTITKGREVVLNGRLGLSNYKKEINGVEVELTKPVIKLTSFHLCGKRPTEDEMQPEDQAPAKKTRAAKS